MVWTSINGFPTRFQRLWTVSFVSTSFNSLWTNFNVIQQLNFNTFQQADSSLSTRFYVFQQYTINGFQHAIKTFNVFQIKNIIFSQPALNKISTSFQRLSTRVFLRLSKRLEGLSSNSSCFDHFRTHFNVFQPKWNFFLRFILAAASRRHLISGWATCGASSTSISVLSILLPCYEIKFQ